jgi:hypothetical protein
MLQELAKTKSGVALDTTSKQGSNEVLKSVNGTKLASGTSTVRVNYFIEVCVF